MLPLFFTSTDLANHAFLNCLPFSVSLVFQNCLHSFPLTDFKLWCKTFSVFFFKSLCISPSFTSLHPQQLLLVKWTNQEFSHIYPSLCVLPISWGPQMVNSGQPGWQASIKHHFCDICGWMEHVSRMASLWSTCKQQLLWLPQVFCG